MSTQNAAARVRTDPRISRRRQAVSRSKRRRIATAVLAVVVTAAVVWGAFWSPLLRVNRVQIVGAKHTGAIDVRNAVELGADDNLLLVSTGRVATAAEQLPWVARAEVHRRLPGTVRIKIEERTPALVVAVAAGTWTIDSRGRVLEEGAVATDLPTLTGASLGSLEPGDRLVTPEVATGLEIWRSVPRRTRADVASIVAPAPERVALAFEDGTLVRYGGADQLRAKNKVLAAVLARLAAHGRDATYIDISVPSTPAVGPPPSPMPTPSPTTAA